MTERQAVAAQISSFSLDGRTCSLPLIYKRSKPFAGPMLKGYCVMPFGRCLIV